MWLEPDDIMVDTFSVLDEKGRLHGEEPHIVEHQIIEMYKWMLLIRLFDERAVKMQRQGRLGTYAPVCGQEAAQVGSAYALRKQDWIFPSYREIGAALVHGMPLSQLFLYPMGHLAGASPPEGVNVFSQQIIIAAQSLHAMGSAWASKYLEKDEVSVAYVGDGATSQGDFHEALNFAAVQRLPIIFFVQNNQWAISVPVSKQTASRTLAQKALAYGISGIRVDGNDLLAVYRVMQEAIRRARQGKPVLVEAVTYRLGAHTTADDPTRYRQQSELENWQAKDPIRRMKSYLMHKKLWNEELEEKEVRRLEQEIAESFKQAEETPRSRLQEAFDHVYETLPPSLKEQKDSLG